MFLLNVQIKFCVKSLSQSHQDRMVRKEWGDSKFLLA
jgi:hypothetical protein